MLFRSVRRWLRKFPIFILPFLLVGHLSQTWVNAADLAPLPSASPNSSAGPQPLGPPDDPKVIKDARSILRSIEPTTSNNAMVYFDQNQVNFKSYISLEKQGAGQAGTGGAINCLTPSDAKCVEALADVSYQQIKYDVAMGSCHIRAVAACINGLTLIKEIGRAHV